jgi:flagellar biosynthetic protein FliO
MDNMGSTLFYIVVMVAVLVGAYVLTKWFSKKSRRMIKSQHICVLDRMALAKDKSLYLTEVGGKCLLIGVTNQSINTLGEIDKEALGDLDTSQKATFFGGSASKASSDTGESGFFGKAASFFGNAKNAQADLAKARMQYKEQKHESAQPDTRSTNEDDILERMNRAIEQRQNRMNGGNGGQS